MLPDRAINTLELSGIEHMRLGELPEAERDLSEALSRRSQKVPDEGNHHSLTSAINNLAVLHLKQRRLDEAAAGFERVVAINEDAQRRAPSSRLSLEINAAKRNLLTAQRLAAQDAEQTPPPLLAPPPPVWSDPLLLPAGPPSSAAASSSAGPSAWAAVRSARGQDVLKTANLKHKERIAEKLGVDTSGLNEADIDAAIKRSVRGGPEAVDGEALRLSVGMAFELLDEDNDGVLSRAELLKGLKGKARVRDMLQLGALADPAEFDAVYRSIDRDASNTIDRSEFESYFLRRLAPPPQQSPYPPPQNYHTLAQYPVQSSITARERNLEMSANAAMRFMQGATTAAQRRQQADSTAAMASADADARAGSPDPFAVGSSSIYTATSEGSDLERYEELTRSLETSQMRRLGLQRDMQALQHQMITVDAEISTKTASTEHLRGILTQHRQAHSAAVNQLDERLRSINRDAKLAARPHLRTAERNNVP